MVSYQYTYLIGNLLFLILWLLLFYYRKDTRKEVLSLSLIFGFVGLIAEHIYIQDWWKPLTITGTAIGIEDFLFGFFIGGIASVFYSILFKKKIKIKKASKIKEEKRNIHFFSLLALLGIIFLLSFYILKWDSLISTILAFIIPTLIIYIKRKDLIKNSLLSGVFTLIGAILIYQLINLITPGFVDQFWLYQNIGRILIFKVPLEEIIWFFLAGAFIGPLYEYWKEGKLINIKK